MLKHWCINLLIFGVVVVSLVFVAAYKVNAQKDADVDVNVTEGCLRSESENGKILEFPLKHTDVVAEISGFLANVEVKQHFKNPYKNKMVVGPRYNPASVTDAANISPPVLKPGRRSGHNISLSVKLDPGLAISNLHSKSHDIDRQMTKDCKTLISIKPQDSIPNKDFILEYQVAGALPKFSYLTHKSQQGGYVMLMLQPSFNSVNYNLQKKEIFFVVDCSGSMSGYPIQKVKEAMYHCIKGLSADDTFQIIRFSENASAFAPKPVPASYYHKEEALDYIQALNGEGGTMAIEGVKACLDAPKTKDRQRIVFFMTDGYIGNENEILEAIKEKKGDTRLFPCFCMGKGEDKKPYACSNWWKKG